MLLERSKNGPNVFSFGQRTLVSFSVKLSIKRKRRLWCPSSEWDMETLKQQYGTLAVFLKPFIYKVLLNGCAVLYPVLLASKRRGSVDIYTCLGQDYNGIGSSNRLSKTCQQYYVPPCKTH